MARFSPSLLLAPLVALGCAEVELVPAESAIEVPEDDAAAITVVRDVEVVVDGDAWAASPSRLGRRVTPVQVSIANRGPVPIRLRLDQFELVALEGKRYAALPPMLIGGQARERVLRPRWAHRGYRIAPIYDPYYDYGAFDFYNGPFGYDPLYYSTYYRSWPAALPSNDMLDYALPEGVLMPGGQVTGFIYFQRVPLQEERVEFRGEIVDAESGELIGTARVPFLVVREGEDVASGAPADGSG